VPLEIKMSDGFFDFSLGTGDDLMSQRSKRFKAEKDHTYRMTMCWFKDFDKDGSPILGEDSIRFTGCERVYKEGVGYFLYKGPAYAEFGAPRQTVATVICVWPANREGDLDKNAFASGTGWQVMPWVFSPDKYREIARHHKRADLSEHDLTVTCQDGRYQKLTFITENSNLLQKLLKSEKEEHRMVGEKILAAANQVAEGIHRDLARDMTVDQIRESLGQDVETPTGGSHTATDVDELLNDVI